MAVPAVCSSSMLPPSPAQSRGYAKQRLKRAVCASGDFSGYDGGTSAHGLSWKREAQLVPRTCDDQGACCCSDSHRVCCSCCPVDVRTAGLGRTITTLTQPRRSCRRSGDTDLSACRAAASHDGIKADAEHGQAGGLPWRERFAWSSAGRKASPSLIA